MMLRRATIYMITNTLTVYISRDTEKDVKPSSLTLALLVLLYSPISPIVADEKKKSPNQPPSGKIQEQKVKAFLFSAYGRHFSYFTLLIQSSSVC